MGGRNGLNFADERSGSAGLGADRSAVDAPDAACATDIDSVETAADSV